MKTLRDKFKTWLNTNPSPTLRDIQCEIIADDFAIEFAMFIKKEYKDIPMTRENYIELLQIYKKEKGL